MSPARSTTLADAVDRLDRTAFEHGRVVEANTILDLTVNAEAEPNAFRSARVEARAQLVEACVRACTEMLVSHFVRDAIGLTLRQKWPDVFVPTPDLRTR